MATTQIHLLRREETCKKCGGISSSTHYQHITEGLMTRPIKIGLRASAWPEHEVDVINAARIAGQSDDEIRGLVKMLEENRPLLFESRLKGLIRFAGDMR